ncbi:MAG: regulatory protein RecX [Pseudomonadales bacterium]|jgi:regulatory protein|nr:regulatory protein RecX [Pseudomonadales bacterium]MDP7144168.1 regulatory protein RecX [Pseudomonadales bacterium]MDP7357726.1 regulatory protein RecX [Pseudomonadales bacterium]MDP7596171.1 regulatory protein RecX [Pseudomonadales bacterium]HJN50428.1 regulatory protein RecX [Pseudomonadales bacterium]|tara:strand:- start:237 stop:680 length:444 start_codon:yes stop_codon:yes gene_type:complete
MDEKTPTTIRRTAMDMLARRDHSLHELRSKLARRFSSATDLIADEVDKLKQEGLQSDERMADHLIRSRVGKGQGPAKIKAELRAKGLSDDLIQHALQQTDVDWGNLVKEVACKRFGDTPPVNQRERAKRVRFLQQRGFLFEHISLVV